MVHLPTCEHTIPASVGQAVNRIRAKSAIREPYAEALGEFNRIHAKWTGFCPGLMLAMEATVLCVWLLALPRLLVTEAALGPHMSLGKFVSFLLYTTMFVYPVEIMGQMARIMHRATSSAHRMFEVLDTRPEVLDDPEAIVLPDLKGKLQFARVTFAYDGVRQVIKGVSFGGLTRDEADSGTASATLRCAARSRTHRLHSYTGVNRRLSYRI